MEESTGPLELGAFDDHCRNVYPGWYPLLAETHAALTRVWPEYRVWGVKEKWGALRINLEFHGPDGDLACTEAQMRACDEVVMAAEERSTAVCELCGEPGVLRQGSWLKTLCDGCAGGAEPSGWRRERWGPHVVVHVIGEPPEGSHDD